MDIGQEEMSGVATASRPFIVNAEENGARRYRLPEEIDPFTKYTKLIMNFGSERTAPQPLQTAPEEPILKLYDDRPKLTDAAETAARMHSNNNAIHKK